MNFDLRSAVPAVVLGALLLAAVVSDVRRRRIPNGLVLAGIVLGLALQATVSSGAGLFQQPFGALGVLAACGGVALGLLLLLPMYALDAMGAGDVKLMAMVGAFLGPLDTVGATLATLLAGGVMGLAAAALQGRLRSVLSNVMAMMLGAAMSAFAGASAKVEAPARPTVDLPYAVAIASGTVLYLFVTRATGWTVESLLR